MNPDGLAGGRAFTYRRAHVIVTPAMLDDPEVGLSEGRGVVEALRALDAALGLSGDAPLRDAPGRAVVAALLAVATAALRAGVECWPMPDPRGLN